LRYYQAGMDMGLSSDPIASFRALQQRILQEYEYMIDAFALLRLDATLSIKEQQRFLREAVAKILPGE
jgi:dTMP kinase